MPARLTDPPLQRQGVWDPLDAAAAAVFGFEEVAAWSRNRPPGLQVWRDGLGG